MNQPILYSKSNTQQKTDTKFVLDNYLRLVTFREYDRILDVGCGSGDVTTKILIPRIPITFKELIGIDLSEEMIRFAASQFIHPSISFKQMDIKSKKIPETFEEHFQHIFSFYALHWVQEQKQAFENLYKLLKTGGDMLFTLLIHHPIFHVYENLASNSKWMDYMKDVQKYISPYQHCEQPEQVVETLMTDCGFSIHLCTLLERKYLYSDLDEFQKSMFAVNPFLSTIPDNMHNDYFLDIVKEIRSFNFIECNNNNNKECVRVPYKLMVVVASKKAP